MPDLVKVRSKESGNVFMTDRVNLNDTVEEVDDETVPLTQSGTVAGVEFIQVRVKESGAIITIDSRNFDPDSVEHVDAVQLPAGEPSESWTRDQLDVYASNAGIDVSTAQNKGDVLEAIKNSGDAQSSANKNAGGQAGPDEEGSQ